MSRKIVLMIGIVLAVSTGDSVYADDPNSHQCFFESIQATYKAGTATYRVGALCKQYSPGEFSRSRFPRRCAGPPKVLTIPALGW